MHKAVLKIKICNFIYKIIGPFLNLGLALFLYSCFYVFYLFFWNLDTFILGLWLMKRMT